MIVKLYLPDFYHLPFSECWMRLIKSNLTFELYLGGEKVCTKLGHDTIW